MGTFHTLLLWRVETIAGLIHIYFYLDKISKKNHLQMISLLKQYTLNSLMEDHHSKKVKPYCLSISKLINKQQYKIKSSIIDFNNWLNKVFPAFYKLHKELSPGVKLVYSLSIHYSFHTVNWKTLKLRMLTYIIKIFDNSISNPNTILVISDACIKNKVTTSISHIH